MQKQVTDKQTKKAIHKENMAKGVFVFSFSGAETETDTEILFWADKQTKKVR